MDDADVTLGNDRLELAFERAGDGLALAAVRDPSHGHAYRVNAAPDDPFWEVEFRNRAGFDCVVDSTDGAVELDRADDERTTLRWSSVPVGFADDGHVTEATVEFDVTLPGDERAARLRPTVEVEDGADLTLWRVSLPAFGDLHRPGADRAEDRLLVPDGWGAYIADPTSADDLAVWEFDEYPGATWPMQFLAFDNGPVGLYLGVHDADARAKAFAVDSPGDALSVRVDHHPEGMGEPLDDGAFAPDYDVVLGTYEGDWYDAAQRYREWATAEAPWATPLADRDVPDWFAETCLWWMPSFEQAPTESGFDPEDAAAVADRIRRLRERFDVPTAVHWYRWHTIPYDTDYPDYPPARPGFADAVAGLQTEDVPVMPYINGRLTDPNGETYRERDLGEAVAKRGSARCDPPGEERFRYPEEYGNGQWMCPACPATEAWQDAVRERASYLAGEVGVSGIYVDQVAAAAPSLCFDPDHDHPPGGGSYGVEGFRDVLAGVREAGEAADVPLGITSECNAEPYMDVLDGYLMWWSARDDQVPLFSTVYGDRCHTFGRTYLPSDLDDGGRAFRAKTAQLFAYGAQLGWINVGADAVSDVEDEDVAVGDRLLDEANADAADYLEALAAAFESARDHVAAGRRLRDPEPTDSLPTHDVRWDMGGGNGGEWDVSLPAVLPALWSAPGEDGVALAVTNWTDERHDPTWTLADAPVGGDVAVSELAAGADAAASVDVVGGAPRLTTDLPPRSVRVFHLRDD